MKIELSTKIKVIGYSRLSGKKHTQIKGRSKKLSTGISSSIIDLIKKTNGSYTQEYRLVKEPKGYIFREVLCDTGISGHHKTMRKAIITAIAFITIHIDEPFEHEQLFEFEKLKKQHLSRTNCIHKELGQYNYCIHCGLSVRE